MIGGKDPQALARLRRKSMPPAIGIIISPKKADDNADSSPAPDAAQPSAGGGKADGDAGAIQPGTTQFHDQSATCSKCEYFDASGMNGVGACTMNVPEADFSTADPDASWCNRFEAAGDDAGETAAKEQSEGAQEPVGATGKS